MGLVRFLLAISVAIFHGAPLFGYPMVWGPNAVTLFFMISGFYMTLVLNSKYDEIGAFFINRALKIFPVYWFAILLAHLLNPIPFGSMPLETALFFIWSNIGIIGSHLTAILQLKADGEFAPLPLDGQFGEGAGAWGGLYIGPVWSLSVELLFYLCAPLLVKIDGRYLWRIGLALLLSLSSLYFFRFQNAAATPWEYNLFLPNLMFFLFGSLSYAAFYKGGMTKTLPFNRVTGAAFWLLLTAAIVLYPMVPKINLGPLHLSTLQVVSIVLLIAMPYVFQFLRHSAIDRYIGNLSYPVYVIHFLIINHVHGAVPVQWRLAATVLLSVLAYHLLMKPIEVRFARTPKRTPA